MIDNLSSSIELFLSCRDLQKFDKLSKSDPFVVVYERDHDPRHEKFVEIGRTSTLKDTHDPDFVEQFKLDYFFEINQRYRLDVYDSDANSRDLSKHEFMGSVNFSLGELVSSRGQSMTIPMRDKQNNQIRNGKKRPRVIIKAEEVDTRGHDSVTLEMSGHGLAAMDRGFFGFGGKSDPYLEFYRSREDNSWVSVYRTETIYSNLNPRWKKFTVSAQKLCNGDFDRPLKVVCYDWDKNDEPDLIGEAVTSLNALVDNEGGATLLLKRPNKKKKNYGNVRVQSASVKKGHSLFEFVGGGMSVQFMVAIDFTGSNGDPRDQRSLHYMGNGHQQNEYQRAIEAIGTVLEPYDTDGDIPVYGFGARINGGSVEHSFHVNLQADPEVHRIAGVMQAYRECVPQLTLSGPTLVANIVSLASSVAFDSWKNNSQQYNILLILTDGIITDKQAATNAIVAASKLPLSIIIVGVGSGGPDGFDDMEYLDADDEPLVNSEGTAMSRDCVQFVPFREFDKAPHLLPKEVLAEIPEQFESFIRMKSEEIGHDVEPMAKLAPVIWRAPSAASSIGGDAYEHKSNFAADPGNVIEELPPPAYS